MIKKIKITNFQPHRKTRLVFDEHVTTIVGPSDRGKSAVIRALRLALQNKPRGDSFIKTGTKHCKVDVWVGDSVVTRERGTANLYSLDGEEFKAFGNDVPAPIERLLAVNDINFQAQHDAPFWFSLNAGEVSKQLNQVINLSIIDDALSETASVVRKAKSTRDLTQDRLEAAKTKEQELAYALEIDADLKQVEQAAEAREQASYRCAALLEAVQKGKELGLQRKNARQQATELESLLAKAKEACELSKQASRLESVLDDLERHEAVKAPPSFDKVKEAYASHSSAKSKATALAKALDGIDTARKELDWWKDCFEKAQKKFHETIEGENCPLCGHEINL